MALSSHPALPDGDHVVTGQLPADGGISRPNAVRIDPRPGTDAHSARLAEAQEDLADAREARDAAVKNGTATPQHHAAVAAAEENVTALGGDVNPRPAGTLTAVGPDDDDDERKDGGD